MKRYTWALLGLHLIIWSVIGIGIFFYAVVPHESSVVKILGSTEKDLSLPVFAQFIVTQSLVFNRSFIASELIIPLYLPNNALPVKISLYQEGRLVTWWKYPVRPTNNAEGFNTAHFAFIVPMFLSGKYELRFDGSSIPHDLQERAPRLFTETFDGAYPDGNYRIANNEKKGDIALQFIETKTNRELWLQDLRTNSFGEITHLLVLASFILLLACMPSSILRACRMQA